MNYWPHLIAMLVGAGLTVQVGMNSTVRIALGSPVTAAVVNFGIGLVALLAVALASGARIAPGAVGTVPGWAWLGGLLGFPQNAVTPARLLGAVLVIIGALLIVRR